jgi:hypothetical protein
MARAGVFSVKSINNMQTLLKWFKGFDRFRKKMIRFIEDGLLIEPKASLGIKLAERAAPKPAVSPCNILLRLKFIII